MTREEDFDLDGLDAETRAACEARAAELGVSLVEYVNDRLLLNLILTQDTGEQEAENAAFVSIAQEEAPIAPTHETHAMRQRLDSLDRRLNLATGRFESTLESLEGSLASLAARADDSEERDAHTSNRIDAALADLRASITALDCRFDGVHAQHETLAHQHAAFRDQTVEQVAGVETRLEQLEDAANHLDRTLLGMQSAMEDARCANAEEIRALGAHIDHEIAGQNADFRTALQELAQNTDTLVTDAIRHAENAAQRATAEARAIHDSLAEKIAETERNASELVETARIEAADRDTAARNDLARLRRATEEAYASLRADAVRQSETQHSALSALEQQMSNDIADVHERQLGDAARIALLDAGLIKLSDDVHLIRAALDERIEDVASELENGLAAAHAAVAHHSEALARRIDSVDKAVGHAHASFKADTGALDARVRSGLETAAREQQNAVAALRHEIEALIQDHHTETGEAQARLEHDLTDVRTLHKGALARLKLIDEALDGQARALGAQEARTTALTERFNRAETEQNAQGSVLKGALAHLTSRVDTMENRAVPDAATLDQALRDIAARLNAHEGEGLDAAARTSEFARLVGALSDQCSALHEAFASMERRFADLAQSFTTRLENLRNDTGEALHSLAQSQTAPEAPGFLAFRAEMEDRLAQIERRSVRALEQLTETVALLAKRTKEDGDEKLAQSA